MQNNPNFLLSRLGDLNQRLIRCSLRLQNLDEPINSKMQSPSFRACTTTMSFFPFQSYFSFFSCWSLCGPTLEAQQRAQGPPLLCRDWLVRFDWRVKSYPDWSLRFFRASRSWRAFERLSVSSAWPRPCFPPGVWNRTAPSHSHCFLKRQTPTWVLQNMIGLTNIEIKY